MADEKDGVEKIQQAIDGEIVFLREKVSALERENARLRTRVTEAEGAQEELEGEKDQAEEKAITAERDHDDTRQFSLDLLRKLEWTGVGFSCPVCYHYQDSRHAPGCELRFALMKLETELVPGVR